MFSKGTIFFYLGNERDPDTFKHVKHLNKHFMYICVVLGNTYNKVLP